MYCIYRNQAAAAAYSSLYFFIFLSLQFSTMKIGHPFLWNCEAYKVEAWHTRGQWVDVLCIPKSECCCCLFVPLFIFFSLQFSNMKIFCRLFLSNCEAYKVQIGTHVENGWMYHGYCCLFFILSNFQTFEILFTLFSGIHPAGDVTRVSVMPRKVTVKIGDAENRCHGCQDKNQ